MVNTTTTANRQMYAITAITSIQTIRTISAFAVIAGIVGITVIMISTANPELKKVGSTGSTLPEHLRFSPGKKLGKQLYKRCLDCISSHIIAENNSIYIYKALR